MEPEVPEPSFRAVDVVPHWAASLGAVSILGALVIPGLTMATGDGQVMMALLLIATLGVTLGICGTILAVRDRRNLVLALLGTVGSLVLPLYMLAGMPWH